MTPVGDHQPDDPQRPAHFRPTVPRKLNAVLDSAQRFVTGLDDLVPVSDEPINQIAVDEAQLVRWTAPLFAACSLALLPWIAILGTSLPQRQLSDHFALAWSGYDALLLLGLTMTAVFALRRSSRLPIAASATAALLIADAWFDVLTSPGGHGLIEAIVMSVCAELPLAVVCLWLAVHSQDIVNDRVRMVLRGRRHRRAG